MSSRLADSYRPDFFPFCVNYRNYSHIPTIQSFPNFLLFMKSLLRFSRLSLEVCWKNTGRGLIGPRRFVTSIWSTLSGIVPVDILKLVKIAFSLPISVTLNFRYLGEKTDYENWFSMSIWLLRWCCWCCSWLWFSVGWAICSDLWSAWGLHQCSLCLATLLGTLSGLDPKNQLRGSLVLELVVSGDWWAFFRADFSAFSAFSED